MAKLNLKNLQRSNDIEAPKDTLGGLQPLESGVYDGRVKLAFLKESKNGATGVELHLDIDGRQYVETVWVTNRNGENFYEKNGVKHYLPGFVLVDELCALTTEAYLADQEPEEKLVEIYDFEAKKEKPTEVPVLTELQGKKAKFGIIQELAYKQELQDGKYVDTDETRSYNVINKVFDEDGYTVLELMDKTEEPEFLEDWKSHNEGNVRDKTKGKTPKASAGKSGTPRKGSLKFNKKSD